MYSWGSYIGHLNFIKSGAEKQGFGTEETVTNIEQAYKYMSKIPHDLDIIMNQEGKGETFGVTNQLNGENTAKLEEFHGR